LDILTDLGAAIRAGHGASANIIARPPRLDRVRTGARFGAGHRRPGHRQPGGRERSAVLMLEHLEPEAAARLLDALETTCREGPRTRDVGGTATTREVGDGVVASLTA
jgi:isocitrate/isopropylmalate dehydrogenase